MPAYSKDRDVLPVAAIYGANASGKSNLLDGLRFMADAVRDSFAVWMPEGGVPRRPFKLDESAGRPSVYVVELVESGVRYTYGFEVDDRRVREEWLYSYPEKRKRVLFERSGGDIKLGTTVTEGAGKGEVLKGLLRPNSLFLSLGAQSGLDAVLPVQRWFANRLVFRDGERSTFDHATIARFLAGSDGLTEQFVSLLKIADLGITGIEYNLTPMPDDEEVSAVARGLRTDYSIEQVREMLESVLRNRDRVRLTHGPKNRAFDIGEESAGTLSWLMLLPTVLGMLRDGGVLAIDEIDASLHPRVTAALVGLFRSAKANVGGAQLVFTTHDASLLSPVLGDEVLTREDVWFVDKNFDGASDLYPLTDFKPRKEGENLERRYLGGSYGAVPDVQAETFVSALLRGVDGAA
ncbi:AAA family ATPase [Lentzea sp. HUAS TT2]|uniref:AAA family ATPase n=1 Tax=Lentzea sp. HUAS TT2 TaxID=3447454 RepID=UPI003F722149